jgi:type II secretory pathway pseudopilin PulG
VRALTIARTGQRLRRGWVMTEMLLGVTVLSLSLALASWMFANNSQDMAAKGLAEQNALFTQAASNYYLNNSSAMITAMTSGTGAASYCVIGASPTAGTGGTTSNDTTLHTCALDAAWLKYNGALAQSFNGAATTGSNWTAIFHLIYNGASPTTNVEMLVVQARNGATFDTPLPVARLGFAAQVAGGNGGLIPGIDAGWCTDKKATTTYQACGGGGTWKVDLSTFISSAQLTTFANALPN